MGYIRVTTFLLTIDPNFLGHPRYTTSAFKLFLTTTISAPVDITSRIPKKKVVFGNEIEQKNPFETSKSLPGPQTKKSAYQVQVPKKTIQS